MNVKKILKIAGFIIGPLIPMAVAIYFLFPYMNEEKHQKIAAKYGKNRSLNVEGGSVGEFAADFETLQEQTKIYRDSLNRLKADIDSVNMLNDSLKNALLAKKEQIKTSKNPGNANTLGNMQGNPANAGTEVNGEDFSEKAKSLLSLDVESLAPILNEMSNNQLIRLFEKGNSLERKKLLRSIESKRAAELMTEVM